MSQSKGKSKPKNSDQAFNGTSKGKATRKRIIMAARRVFTKHPYDVASIRMIGNEGGFDYSLIHHYFPTKVALMEAVAEDVYKEYIDQFGVWFQGLEEYSTLKDSLSAWLDRVLEHSFENPDALKLIMQNMSRQENLSNTAGLRYFPLFYRQIQQGFSHKYSPMAGEDEVLDWVYGVTIMIANCVGAAEYHSLVLGVEKNTPEYRQRVKRILMTLFLPGLRNLFRSPPKE